MKPTDIMPISCDPDHPPGSGTYVWGSIDGVRQWIDTTERESSESNKIPIHHGDPQSGKEDRGTGTELKRLIARFGVNAVPGCKCNQHIREMNKNGIEWCQQNIEIIAGWLKEEAVRARLPFSEAAAKIVIRRAITNAKKELLTSTPK